ncbi:MAG: hypothetical protein AB8F74_22845 [Saprospiraceae bacterium]
MEFPANSLILIVQQLFLDYLPSEEKYDTFQLSSQYKTSYDNKKLYARHFPSDDDLIDEFRDLIERKRVDYFLYSETKTRLLQKGCSTDRLFKILVDWFNEEQTIEIFEFTCQSIGAFGNRSDLGRLGELNTVGLDSEKAELLKWEAEYNIKRRSLK